MSAVMDGSVLFVDSNRVRIPDLDPDLVILPIAHVESTVALVWPYSSSSGTFSLLLVEKDIRLRKSRGQLKVTFEGACAREVAKTQVGIGDVIKLGLQDASWKRTGDLTSTPGKKNDWDATIRKRVRLEVTHTNQEPITVNFQSRQEPLIKPSVGDLTETIPVQAVSHSNNVSTPYRTPKRTSLGSYIDVRLSPFVEDDGYVSGRGRKRTKFARPSGAWKLLDDEDEEPILPTETLPLSPALTPGAEEVVDQSAEAADSSAFEQPQHAVVTQHSSPIQLVEDTDTVGQTLPPSTAHSVSHQEQYESESLDPPSMPAPEAAPSPVNSVPVESLPYPYATSTAPFIQPVPSDLLPLTSPFLQQGSDATDHSAQEGMPSGASLLHHTQNLPDITPTDSHSAHGLYILEPSTPIESIELQPDRLYETTSFEPVSEDLDLFRNQLPNPFSVEYEDLGIVPVSDPLHPPGHVFLNSDSSPTEVDFDALQQHIEDQAARVLSPAPPTHDPIPIDESSPNIPVVREELGNSFNAPHTQEISSQYESSPQITQTSETITVPKYDLAKAAARAQNFAIDGGYDAVQSEDERISSRAEQESGRQGAEDQTSKIVNTSPEPYVEVTDHTQEGVLIPEDRADNIIVHDIDITRGPEQIEILSSPIEVVEAHTPQSNKSLEAPNSAIEAKEGILDFSKDEDEESYEIAGSEYNQILQSNEPHLQDAESQTVVHKPQMLTPHATQEEPRSPTNDANESGDRNMLPPTPSLTQKTVALVTSSPVEPEPFDVDVGVDVNIGEPLLPALDSSQIPPVSPRSRRRLTRKSLHVETAGNEFFTPRRSARVAGITSPIMTDGLLSEDMPVSSMVPMSPVFEQSTEVLEKARTLTTGKGVQTETSYYPSLAHLNEHYNQHVDVLAICTEPSSVPSRAKSGPKDFHTTIHLADPSNAENTTTTVQIFRPRKNALPTAKRGDAVLLRDMKVQSKDHRIMLLSTDTSAWAFFHPGSDDVIDVKSTGPPIEYRDGEIEYCRELFDWWRAIGEQQYPDLPVLAVNTASNENKSVASSSKNRSGKLAVSEEKTEAQEDREVSSVEKGKQSLAKPVQSRVTRSQSRRSESVEISGPSFELNKSKPETTRPEYGAIDEVEDEVEVEETVDDVAEGRLETSEPIVISSPTTPTTTRTPKTKAKTPSSQRTRTRRRNRRSQKSQDQNQSQSQSQDLTMTSPRQSQSQSQPQSQHQDQNRGQTGQSESLVHELRDGTTYIDEQTT